MQDSLAQQAALGLLGLERLQIAHCDVSSRNCLLDHSSPPVLKIADLGRAIRLGDHHSLVVHHKVRPERWLPPESLEHNIYGSHTDAWSYGVLLWEISHGGARPYQDLADSEVLLKVISGDARLPEAPSTSPRLRVLRNTCLQRDACSRPSFGAIVHFIELAGLQIAPDTNSQSCKQGRQTESLHFLAQF
ncbi:Serine-threonine/tyrosine-protein kinase catalytic domain [Trinorchestia longiramus]|nr:Serine-threonine/tyrosine-protein kinase catalytic domain [Trinorchestia longiramus]